MACKHKVTADVVREDIFNQVLRFIQSKIKLNEFYNLNILWIRFSIEISVLPVVIMELFTEISILNLLDVIYIPLQKFSLMAHKKIFMSLNLKNLKHFTWKSQLIRESGYFQKYFFNCWFSIILTLYLSALTGDT